MKHVLRTALCTVLILVMAGGTCLSAFAAGEDQYVSEVKIEFGDAGKKALADAGYTVKDYNLNNTAAAPAGRTQSSVWLGYKTTSNPDEAITDMGVINMKGDYSFTDYAAALETQSDKVGKMVASMRVGIDEFKANYKAERPSALYAFEALNLMFEDDSQMTLGRFILSATDKQLETMFLEGNTDYLALVQKIIAIGLADDDDDTVFTRLEEMDIEDDYKSGLASVNRRLYDEIGNIQVYLKAFYEETEKMGGEFSQQEFEAHLEKIQDSCSGTGLMNILNGYECWSLTKDVDYAGSGLTLLELFEKPQNELSDYWLNPLAAALTAGQASYFPTSGLIQIFSASALGQDEHETNAAKLSNQVKFDEPLSVYTNVDRRVFEPDGIALMAEASKASSNNSGSSWTVGDTSVKKNDGDGILTMAMVATVLTCMGLTAMMFVVGIGSYLTEASFGATFASYIFGTGLGVAAFAVIVVLAIVAIACFLLYYVFDVFKNDEDVKQKLLNKSYAHSRKPEILVTRELDANDKEFYGYYYAVTRLDGSIADLNGEDNLGEAAGEEVYINPEWNVMYTTKDKRLGNPILADFSIQTKNDIPAGRSAVHNFTRNSEGIKPAANLNYGLASAKENIFMFVQHEAADGAGLTGSAFSDATLVLIGLVSFIVGGSLFGGISAVRGKKKEQTA